MLETLEIKVPIIKEPTDGNWTSIISQELSIPKSDILDFRLLKRSIDARGKTIQVFVRLEIGVKELLPERPAAFNLQEVSSAPEVHIIGCGPAGLFAALECIHLGFKPILFERGKDVKARRRDLASLTKSQIVNPESNYCFGEGGAGTYSDGKLYTRSKKRGDVNRVLEGLVQFGANANILYNAHPHIGTNKLPQLIVNMREAILKAGGQIHFESKLTNISLKDSSIQSIEINHEQSIPISRLILATGHSARDIFKLLNKKKIKIEAKPFALGVRVEHPQEFINKQQYKSNWNNPSLEPAAYKLVTQINDKGVYSFCMCPGGIIAPCATNKGEIVTNGWSPSKRNNPYANSGIVVSLNAEDWSEFHQSGPLAAMHFQHSIEKKAHQAANNDSEGQKAPAQRLVDFIANRESKSLPKCSYLPGVVSARLDQILPKNISDRLKLAFIEFDRKIKGYLHPNAILVGVESRTSSPVSIPRDKETLHHIDVKNLYPCGEGAGYAGGIVSAAIDGIKCAGALTRVMQ